MSNPTTGILDNYNLRFNWGTNQLEMNTGEEVWIAVPTSGGGAPGGDDTALQYNNSGAFGGISNVTTDGTILQIANDTLLQLGLYGGDPADPAGFTFDNNTSGYIIGQVHSLGNGGLFSFGSRKSFVLAADVGGTFFPHIELSTEGYLALDVGATQRIIMNVSGVPIFTLDTSGITVPQINTAQVNYDDGGLSITASAGGVTVASNGTTVANFSTAASASLTLDSTTQGFLPPRMTTTQRDAITSPAEGLTVYNTSTHTVNFWNGSAWTAV